MHVLACIAFLLSPALLGVNSLMSVDVLVASLGHINIAMYITVLISLRVVMTEIFLSIQTK